jgi:hypothetical protein
VPPSYSCKSLIDNDLRVLLDLARPGEGAGRHFLPPGLGRLGGPSCRALADVLTDAWIAASVLQLNEHLVTFDRGFRRLLPPRHLTILAT